MWLLDVETQTLEFFHDGDIKFQYAILSHTWEGDEVTFQDIQNLTKARLRRGFQKIEYLCTQSSKDGLKYAWIDTCCIDKSSSAELSEAINSMYKWYANSAVCYAYLCDISTQSLMTKCPSISRNEPRHTYQSHPELDSGPDTDTDNSVALDPYRDQEYDILYVALYKSRWFTRGWTLQEMIAPYKMKFYGPDWVFVGTDRLLSNILERITEVPWDRYIPPRYDSNGYEVESICAARKVSWAACRQTTRPEDRAYSLLGIFDINMVLLYGEGEFKAFERLQMAILKETRDLSLLLWDRRSHRLDDYTSRLLAETIDVFSFCGNIVPVSIYAMNRQDHFEILEGPILELRLTMAIAPQEDASTTKTSYAIFNYRHRYQDQVGPMAMSVKLITGDHDSETTDSVYAISSFDRAHPDYKVIPPTELERAVKRNIRLTPLPPSEWQGLAGHDGVTYMPRSLLTDDWCWQNVEVISHGAVWRRHEPYSTYLVDQNTPELLRQIDEIGRDLTLKHGEQYIHILFKDIRPTGLENMSFCHIQIPSQDPDPPQRASIPHGDWIWLPATSGGGFVAKRISLDGRHIDIVHDGYENLYVQLHETTIEKGLQPWRFL